MVRARAANRIGASIPFGAAHRVYFVLHPERVLHRGTRVPVGEPLLNLRSGCLKFLHKETHFAFRFLGDNFLTLRR